MSNDVDIKSSIKYTLGGLGFLGLAKGINFGYKEIKRINRVRQAIEEGRKIGNNKYYKPDKSHINGAKGEKKTIEQLASSFDWYVTNVLYKNNEIDLVGYKNGRVYFIEIKNWVGDLDLKYKDNDECIASHPLKGNLELSNGILANRENPAIKIIKIAKKLECAMRYISKKELPIDTYVVMANSSLNMSERLSRSEVFCKPSELIEKIGNRTEFFWTLEDLQYLTDQLRKLDEVYQREESLSFKGLLMKQYYKMYKDKKMTDITIVDFKNYSSLEIKKCEHLGYVSNKCFLTRLDGDIEVFYNDGGLLEIDVFNGKRNKNSIISFNYIKKIELYSLRSIVVNCD